MTQRPHHGKEGFIWIFLLMVIGCAGNRYRSNCPLITTLIPVRPNRGPSSRRVRLRTFYYKTNPIASDLMSYIFDNDF